MFSSSFGNGSIRSPSHTHYRNPSWAYSISRKADSCTLDLNFNQRSIRIQVVFMLFNNLEDIHEPFFPLLPSLFPPYFTLPSSKNDNISSTPPVFPLLKPHIFFSISQSHLHFTKVPQRAPFPLPDSCLTNYPSLLFLRPSSNRILSS